MFDLLAQKVASSSGKSVIPKNTVLRKSRKNILEAYKLIEGNRNVLKKQVWDTLALNCLTSKVPLHK